MDAGEGAGGGTRRGGREDAYTLLSAAALAAVVVLALLSADVMHAPPNADAVSVPVTKPSP